MHYKLIPQPQNGAYSFFMLVIFLACTIYCTANAAEIDSVTSREVDLDNSRDLINAIFNNRIQEGITRANERAGNMEDDGTVFCDEELLYTELRKAIFQSYTASWGLKGFSLDKELRILLAKQSYSLSLNDSIYRDIDYLEGFSLNIKELSDVIRLDNQLIGLDKIGHFFAEGWQYFEQTLYEEQSLEAALKWGKEQEVGKFGYTTTGIFSFSDLTANFNGWRFWNKVLLNESDPINSSFSNFFNQPYVDCKVQLVTSTKLNKVVKAWELNRQFDISDYVDGAWDEGNNCNSYADPMIEEKIRIRTKNIYPDFVCPVTPGQCSDAQDRYGSYAKYILHPYCLTQ